MKLAILSDTHGLLRPEVTEHLKTADAILHGGDINRQSIVDELRQYAPLYIVRGNNDKDWAEAIPRDLTVALGGVTFFMVHNRKEVPADLETLFDAPDGLCPDAKIEVMDSAAATVTEATMVENAVAIRDAGCTLDEAVTWLEAEKSTNNIFFTVGNLDYLIKGGRIGKVSGRAANFLGIKPMILFKDGEIFSGGVARGRQKSFEKALEQLMNYLDANGGTPDDYRIIVGYGYDEEEGKRLWMQTRAALRAKYPAAQCEVGLLQIGSTIAVHTGPYALGMGIMRRWKKQ